MRHIPIVIACCGYWFAYPVFAADLLPTCTDGLLIQEIELPNALTAAYGGNPQLLSVRQDLEKSQAQVVGALSGFLPSANFSMQGQQYVSYQKGGIPVAVGSTVVGGQPSLYTSYPSVSANWNLFDGGKDIAAYRGAKASVRAAQGDVDQQIDVTLIAVLSAYSDLLKAQSIVEQQHLSIESLEQIQSRTEQRFQQNRASLIDVNQARGTLEQNERDYYASCKTLVDKSSALAQAIGLRQSHSHLLKAVSSLPDAAGIANHLASDAADFDNLVEQDPAVISAREKVDVAQRKLDQARASYRPTLALVGRYDWLGQHPSNFVDAWHGTEKNGYQVGVVLQQPLGPFTSEYAAIESAHADLAKAQLGVDSARIEADAKLHSAWSAKRQTAQALKAAKRSVVHAEEFLELTRQTYTQGRVGMDKIDQARIMLEKEREALAERLLEDTTTGWLLDRALNPGAFPDRLMTAVGQPLLKSGDDRPQKLLRSTQTLFRNR